MTAGRESKIYQKYVNEEIGVTYYIRHDGIREDGLIKVIILQDGDHNYTVTNEFTEKELIEQLNLTCMGPVTEKEILAGNIEQMKNSRDSWSDLV